MKILAVEDDPVALALLGRVLGGLGHEVVPVASGHEARVLLEADNVRVVVSDWEMADGDGLELCRYIRGRENAEYVYFILLSVHEASEKNQREAVDAGVDDFLTKPLRQQDIWMRLRVAERILRYATQVRQLEAFLPICAYCKKIRADRGYWEQLESYINKRTGTDFSHSVCPDCYQRVVLPEIEAVKAEQAAARVPRCEGGH